MSVFVDSSALLAAVVDGRDRQLVLDTVDAAWEVGVCASAIALTEALAAVDRLAGSDVERADLEDAVRRLWDHLHVIPVDQRCLDDAARLARERPLRLAGAIHLAAALRLPPPVQFVTVDAAHVPAAVGLGCDVVAP